MSTTLILAILLIFCEKILSCNDVNKEECEGTVLNQSDARTESHRYDEFVKDEQLIIFDEPTGSDFVEGSGADLKTQLALEGSGSDPNSQDDGSGRDPNFEDARDDCVESGYTAVCSGKGVCVNNKCRCNSNEFEIGNSTVLYRYSGRYCEECPYCKGQRCAQFLPCIECNLFQKDANCIPYCMFQYEIVEVVSRDVDNDEKLCDVENSEGCFFKFKYRYNGRNSVTVQYEKEIFCFNGLKFVTFTFWGVVVYIFVLTMLVPRICYLKRGKISSSRISLSRRHDILRLDFFR
ncbi:unnamed protein product [Tenebrio molitor]|nr:unnamed protein product [Tenebrio molitor]